MADHTQGLSSAWSRGAIHCSPTTARLLEHKFTIPRHLIVSPVPTHGLPALCVARQSLRPTLHRRPRTSRFARDAHSECLCEPIGVWRRKPFLQSNIISFRRQEPLEVGETTNLALDSGSGSQSLSVTPLEANHCRPQSCLMRHPCLESPGCAAAATHLASCTPILAGTSGKICLTCCVFCRPVVLSCFSSRGVLERSCTLGTSGATHANLGAPNLPLPVHPFPCP